MAKSKMDDDTLQAIVNAAKSDALAALTSLQLSENRAKAMDYYVGDMTADMPTQDGRSSAVSSDVADTVEGLMPQLMDILAGSDEVVRFEPVGPEDEAAAEQESDYVNHVFMQQNPGYRVMYDFVKDALLEKVGIVKIWWEENEVEENETYYGLSPDQFALLSQDVLQSDGHLEIIEHTVNEGENAALEGGDVPESPQEAPEPPTHDVKVRSTKKLAQAKVVGVPPEEWGIERGARSIKDSNYCFHDIVTKTQDELVDEGFDLEDIEGLTDYTGRSDIETLARDTVQEHFNTGAGQIDAGSRRIKITEHYLRVDYQGTGRPCLYQIVTGGDKGAILHKNGKLAIEEFDQMPFAGATPVPVAHRFFGRSLADQVMDIQRVKTALLRGVLDNSYMVTNPRIEVSEAHAGPNTIDDLLVSRPNGVVRTKQPGGLMPFQTPPIGQYLMPVMDYMDAIREMRTGVTRQGQGVDADALQNQSATAVQQVFSASQARMKLIARIMAEGVRDIFALLHATIRKHGQEAQTIRLRNNWVSVDPRTWKTRNDMTINVALGNGGKAEQIGQLTVIGNIQKEMLLGGKSNIVDDGKLFNLASEIVKLTGHKNPDRFFNNPDAKNPQTGQLMYPPPPPQTDPKVQAAQMKAQTDMQANEQKAQLEQQKAQTDSIHQQVKLQAEVELAKIKADLDAKMALLDAHLKMVTSAQSHRHAEQQHQAGLAETHLGMVATAHAHDAKIELAREAAKNKPRADA